MHQLVNKDFDSAKMHGTAVKIKKRSEKRKKKTIHDV
jgi:hypothetical protein